MKRAVRFTANWCGPCKVFAPVFDKVTTELNIPMEIIDVSQNDAPARDANVFGLPTVILYNNDIEVARFSGNKSEADVRAAFEKAFK